MKRLIVLSLLFLSSLAFSKEVVTSCKVGSKDNQLVEIVRDGKVYDTHVYYLKVKGNIVPVFDDEEHSRGSSVKVICAGKNNRALILSGEFTANAIQGLAITYAQETGTVDRLDFAEKSRPIRLYINKKDVWLVFPTYGHGEFSQKYIMYSHIIGDKKDADIKGIDQFPKNISDMEVVKLKQ
ncbi:hypothetical protein [Serratia sp. D1N4]